MDHRPISHIIQSKIKKNNEQKNASFSLENLKIKKIKYTQDQYKIKIDKVVRKLLLDTYRLKSQNNVYFDENNLLHYQIQIKKISRPTPFQIYEKIKSFRNNKIKDNNLDKLRLSPQTLKSSISANTNNFKKNIFIKSINKKENKFRYTNYISPLRKRISKITKELINKKDKLSNSDNIKDFSKMIIKNDLTTNNNKYNMKTINGRNININGYKTNKNLYKKNFLPNESYSFRLLKKKIKLKNLFKLYLTNYFKLL